MRHQGNAESPRPQTDAGVKDRPTVGRDDAEMSLHTEFAPAVARRRAGVFTATQARDAGWTRRQVEHRLATGRWRRVAGLGLTAEPLPDDGRRRAWAATLTVPDAVVARRTAAEVWGFPTVSAGEVEIYASGRTRRLRGIRALEGLPDLGDRRAIGGLVLTSPIRTVLDCCAHLPWDQSLDLYAWATSRTVLSHADLAQALRLQFGRHGNAQLARLTAYTAHGAVSAAEHRCHALLRRAGITGWQAGATVRDALGVIGVVDLLFEAARLVVEIDGLNAHSGRRSFVQDRRRQNRLVNAGYRVLRFTWWDLVDHPGVVVDQVLAALAVLPSSPMITAQ